jgi:hypothetical protein
MNRLSIEYFMIQINWNICLEVKTFIKTLDVWAHLNANTNFVSKIVMYSIYILIVTNLPVPSSFGTYRTYYSFFI